MKFRKTKRIIFVSLSTLLCLMILTFINDNFFIVSQFLQGFLCCAVAIIARLYFNTKYVEIGEYDFMWGVKK